MNMDNEAAQDQAQDQAATKDNGMSKEGSVELVVLDDDVELGPPMENGDNNNTKHAVRCARFLEAAVTMVFMALSGVMAVVVIGIFFALFFTVGVVVAVAVAVPLLVLCILAVISCICSELCMLKLPGR